MLKKIIGILILLSLMVLSYQYLYPQKMKIKEGDTVPQFTLKDQAGQSFNSEDFIGKVPMVIYFYPKNDTPGCTAEACSFRDEYETFTDMDVKVVGISADDVASHKQFADKYNLPFTLLADVDKKVRKLFGVPKSILGLLPGRVTYVVDRSGKVIHIFNSQFKAEQHIQEAIAALKNN